ncbi:MAG: archaeosortase/exosortase family protein [Bryobacteraceae bacterium]
MAERAETTFLSQSGAVAQSLVNFANPLAIAESLFLVLAAATIAVVQNASGDGDGRADALLSAIIVFRALSSVAPVERKSNAAVPRVAAVLGIVCCTLLIANSLGLAHLPRLVAANPRWQERIFPLAAIFFWWAVSPNRRAVPALLRNLLLAAVTVCLWTDLWDVVSWLAGDWILESTIVGSITALYYLGYDVLRHGTILHLGHGAIDILLGCTGLPILRLLAKLIVAESAVLGLKRRSWYFKAALVALAISIFIGPFRVAVLTVASSHSDQSFLFWHGAPGIGMFSALAMVLFLAVIARLRPDPVGCPPERTNSTGMNS